MDDDLQRDYELTIDMTELGAKLTPKSAFSWRDHQFPEDGVYEIIAASPARETVELQRVDPAAPVGEDTEIVKGFPESNVPDFFNSV